jgi:hypothetical protein
MTVRGPLDLGIERALVFLQSEAAAQRELGKGRCPVESRLPRHPKV